jgi:hypothetical protein
VDLTALDRRGSSEGPADRLGTSNFLRYVPPWKRTRQETQPATCLLAKPTQLNINRSSDRFAMFNKQRDITPEAFCRFGFAAGDH